MRGKIKSKRSKEGRPAPRRKLDIGGVMNGAVYLLYGLVPLAFFLGIVTDHINTNENLPLASLSGIFFTLFALIVFNLMMATKNGAVVPEIKGMWSAIFHSRRVVALFILSLLCVSLAVLSVLEVFSPDAQDLIKDTIKRTP